MPLSRFPLSKFWCRLPRRKARKAHGRGLSITPLEDRVTPTFVGDFVWRDNNANGVQDAGEPGVAGVYVRLLKGGAEWASARTDQNGGYGFWTGPAGSDYAVQVEVPAGFALSPADQGGDDAKDSDFTLPAGAAYATTALFAVDPGIANLSIDAGLIPPAPALGDRVWRDDDGDGVQDDGERGIPGVAVELLNNSTLVASTTSDANGKYSFDISSLPAGNTYHVRLPAVPTGYKVSPLDQGGNDASDNDFSAAVGTVGVAITGLLTIGPGLTDLTVDAGLVPAGPPGPVGDRVWRDNNANGVQDAGEPGVAGVYVRLLKGGAEWASARTDQNGNYGFGTAGFPAAADYAVQVEVPGGFALSAADQGGNDATDSDFTLPAGAAYATTALFALDPGIANLSIDAGLIPPPNSLGDKVWRDDDADGVQDESERGVPGVPVRLVNNGTLVASTTTDANGKYSFDLSGLAAGNQYWVELTSIPTGYKVSLLDQGGNDATDNDFSGGSGLIIRTNPITIGPGVTDLLTVDAGLIPAGPPGPVGDRVWRDSNANGVQDAGEPGVAGVYVRLLKGGAEWASARTDQNGNYGFGTSGFPAGSDYAVQIQVPAGFALSAADQGGNDVTDSDFTLPAGAQFAGTGLFAVDPGIANPSLDAGLVPSRVGDTVWRDDDGDGVQDAGEPGIAGVTVRLMLTGNIVASAVTDAAGKFFFDTTGLTASSSYWLQLASIPADFTLSPLNAGGNEAQDNDFFSANAWTDFISIGPGVTNLDVDCGLIPPGIGDRVWQDNDGDGTQDPDEPGIAGVTVRMNKGFPSPVLIATDITDQNGNYGFLSANLVAGSDYWFQIDLPAGYALSPVNVGNDNTDNDFSSANAWTGNYTLGPGAKNLSIDAGLVPTKIGDRVWRDNNRNGIQDNGEPGVAGVTVEFLTNGTVSLPPATTNPSGFYSFSTVGQPSGTNNRSLRFTIPAGYTLSPANQGSDDTKDSDFTVTPAAGFALSPSFSINPPIVNLTLDAGLIPDGPQASVSDASVVETDGETATMTFTVTLNQAGSVPVSVDFTTANNSATVFSDYMPATGTLTFAPGETTKTVQVSVLADDIWEPNETFLLRLSNSINGSIADDLGVGTIIEDEPVPTVSISDATVTEGNSGTTDMAFTVTLSGPTQLFFPYRIDALSGGTAVAGADFGFTSVPLNIGGNLLTYTVNVPVFGETYTEPDETFVLRLVRTQGGPTVADEIGVGTILNDDPTTGTMTFPAVVAGLAQDSGANGTWDSVFPGASFGSDPVRKLAGEVEYRTLYEFDVSRVIEGAVTHALFSFAILPIGFTGWVGTFNVVGYAGNGVLDLGDANVVGPTLAGFGDPNQTGRRTVVLNRDQVLALTAGSDWLGLRIQASSATADVPINNPLAGPANAPVVTFRTDTPVVPAISVNDVSVPESSTHLRFTITLSAPTVLPVTVKFTLANGTATAGSDFAVPTILTVYFEPGETSKQVAVFLFSDTVVEPDETMFLNLSDAENATIADGQGQGTILNDDPAP